MKIKMKKKKRNRGTFDHFQTLTGHIGTVRALAVSVTGRYLFSGSMDRTVMVIFFFSKNLIFNIQFNFNCIYLLKKKDLEFGEFPLYSNFISTRGRCK